MGDLYKPTNKQRKAYAHNTVCVLTPCADYESPGRFMRSACNMLAYSWMCGLRVEMIQTTERMVVDWARNDLARKVKESKSPYTGRRYTHCFWLDDDMVFDPDILVYLMCEGGDKDMISALYFGRSEPLPVVYVKDGEETADEKYKYFPLMKVPPKTFECDAAGFGAMLMKVDVFDRVPEPWFTIDFNSGEDIAFCTHAREHGVKIWCAGAYRLGHIAAPTIVTEEHHEAYIASRPDIMEKFKRLEL